MSARRAPVEPPRDVKATLKGALKSGETIVYQGISMMPPTGTRATWRVKGTTAGKSVELSGGRDIATAWAACLAVHEQLSALRIPAPAGPRNAHKSVAELLDFYFQLKGPKGKWSARTVNDRERDFRKLREVCGEILCRDLTEDDIADYIQQAAGTYGRAATLSNVTATLLKFGRKHKYLTPEQVGMADDPAWPAPGAAVEARPDRREQAEEFGGGNVMTHDQVNEFADACKSRYAHGDGLVHVAANLGLRSAELRLLTADAAVGRSGGNYVDTKAWQVNVHHQVDDATLNGTKLPKSRRRRTVVVPAKAAIGTGFDVRRWLTKRCKEALAEQAAGENDRALLFPTESGGVWDSSNLRNQVWGPAVHELGWRMDDYKTARNRSLALYRFTLHSLRDRFATTAINEWKYTEEQILIQGGWRSSAIIRQAYAGHTDQTLGSVRRLHGLT